MYATAGNLSIFDPQSGLIWITASGKDKSKLKTQDFVTLELSSGKLVGENEGRPSAETSIHQAIYRNFPNIRTCLHVHTPTSCILEFGLNSSKTQDWVVLPNIEILKAFGNFNENPNLSMMVLYNHGNVPKIASEFEQAILQKSMDLPFFLIENHGVTVWGRNVAEANKHLEAAEFIFQVMVGRKNS
jgi:methylthioribulose-1-phosphate dehydratase